MGWQIYDEQSHSGVIRHLGLRIGRRTGEILLTLVVRDWNISGIETPSTGMVKPLSPVSGSDVKPQ